MASLHLSLSLCLLLVLVAVEHARAFYLPGTQPVDFVPGDEVTLMVRHSLVTCLFRFLQDAFIDFDVPLRERYDRPIDSDID